MKYYVRTTGERTLDESFSQIEYTLLVDVEHKNGVTFAKWFKEYFCKEDCVILEDDIVLCKDFKSRIEEVISQHPDDVVNFFEDIWKYLPTIKRLYFHHCQCLYFPKEISQKIVDTIEKYNISSYYNAELLRLCFEKMNYEHLLYRPCLVQHIGNKSLVGHNNSKLRRGTFYFIDYLDKLNLTYDEAKYHISELKNLMEEQLSRYD